LDSCSRTPLQNQQGIAPTGTNEQFEPGSPKIDDTHLTMDQQNTQYVQTPQNHNPLRNTPNVKTLFSTNP